MVTRKRLVGPAGLKDVAKLARVSVSTASRALTRPHLVKESTVRDVQEAARRVGYIPQAAGRALSSRRTRTVGAILPDLDNAIFANTANAMQRKLAEHGYMLLLACDDYSLDTEMSLTRMLLERGVDGLVLTGIEHHPGLFAMVEAAGVPFVFTWAFDDSLNYSCVGFDNRKAGALAANHMAQLGHRKIGVVTAYTRYTERHRERINGIRATLESRDIELPPDLVHESQLSFQSGREGVRKFFAYGNPPTALICSNDVIAIGAMAECQELGLKVPEDVSVMGFEDLEIASYIRPALSTIRWSQRDLGRYAAEAILGHLEHEQHQPRHVEIPVELVIRNTTAPLHAEGGTSSSNGSQFVEGKQASGVAA